jgi:Spy/CpxP family protein refolding chaperone
MLQRMTRQLELTETQQQFARDLFKQTKDQAKPVRDQLRDSRQKLHAAIKAGDEGEINRLTTEQAQLQAQVHALRAKAMSKFYAQLTPEQKTKADQMQERFQNRMKNRFNKQG